MATTVTIGGTEATDVTVTSATELTAVVPAGAAGPADVVVTTSEGSDTLADGYTYVDAPTADSLDPATGSEDGGTTVTVTGTGFVDGETTVTVDGEDVTVTVVSDTELTFDTPAHEPGDVDVVVSGTGGSADPLTFTYTADLTVTAIDPDAGPTAGGNTVTITGTGFETA